MIPTSYPERSKAPIGKVSKEVETEENQRLKETLESEFQDWKSSYKSPVILMGNVKL